MTLKSRIHRATLSLSISGVILTGAAYVAAPFAESSAASVSPAENFPVDIVRIVARSQEQDANPGGATLTLNCPDGRLATNIGYQLDKLGSYVSLSLPAGSEPGSPFGRSWRIDISVPPQYQTGPLPGFVATADCISAKVHG